MIPLGAEGEVKKTTKVVELTSSTVRSCTGLDPGKMDDTYISDYLRQLLFRLPRSDKVSYHTKDVDSSSY